MISVQIVRSNVKWLCGNSGTSDLAGLVADDSRWGHIANGERTGLDQAPVIVSDRDSVISKIEPVEGENLRFTINSILQNADDKNLVLEPFYKIHDARYMLYWLTITEERYQEVLDSLAVVESELEMEARKMID